jgi:hypothetical protein
LGYEQGPAIFSQPFILPRKLPGKPGISKGSTGQKKFAKFAEYYILKAYALGRDWPSAVFTAASRRESTVPHDPPLEKQIRIDAPPYP